MGRGCGRLWWVFANRIWLEFQAAGRSTPGKRPKSHQVCGLLDPPYTLIPAQGLARRGPQDPAGSRVTVGKSLRIGISVTAPTSGTTGLWHGKKTVAGRRGGDSRAVIGATASLRPAGANSVCNDCADLSGQGAASGFFGGDGTRKGSICGKSMSISAVAIERTLVLVFDLRVTVDADCGVWASAWCGGSRERVENSS